MASFNISFVNDVRATVKTQYETISTGKIKTGKEIVRDGIERLSERSENRHKRLLAKFVEEEGKGNRIDVSA